MLRRFVGLVVLVLALPSLAGAQTLEDLEKRVSKLEEGLTGLSKSVTELGNQLSEQLELQRQLADKLEASNEQLRQQNTRQQQILDQISTVDGSTGRPIPRLSANMRESAEFKQDVYDAVHDSLERQGTFSIENKMNSYQRVVVNKQEYGIRAGETLTLKVPVGTVTTRIPGRGSKNWTLSAPGYKEDIEIVPSSSTVVYSPVYEASSYSAPVYSGPTYFQPTYTYYYPPTYLAW